MRCGAHGVVKAGAARFHLVDLCKPYDDPAPELRSAEVVDQRGSELLQFLVKSTLNELLQGLMQCTGGSNAPEDVCRFEQLLFKNQF